MSLNSKDKVHLPKARFTHENFSMKPWKNTCIGIFQTQEDTKWCLSISSTCTISPVVSMQMNFHLCLQPSFSSLSQDLYSHLYLDIHQTSSSTRCYFLSQAYFYPTFFELIVPSSKSFTCEASALWFLWLPCWPHSVARSSWSYFHLNPEIYTIFSPLT